MAPSGPLSRHVGTASDTGGFGMNACTLMLPFGLTKSSVLEAASSTSSPHGVARTAYGFASGNCSGTSDLCSLLHWKSKPPTFATTRHLKGAQHSASRPNSDLAAATVAGETPGGGGPSPFSPSTANSRLSRNETPEIPSAAVPSFPSIEAIPETTL